jgi:hypothetical protein
MCRMGEARVRAYIPGMPRTIAVLAALALGACGGTSTGPTLTETLTVDPGTGAQHYLFTLEFDEPLAVGLNPFALTIEEEQDVDVLVPVPGRTVTVTPFMPGHGHGAPGSIDPEHVGDGRYEGAVSFSMPGYWTIDFNVSDLETVQFEVTF